MKTEDFVYIPENCVLPVEGNPVLVQAAGTAHLSQLNVVLVRLQLLVQRANVEHGLVRLRLVAFVRRSPVHEIVVFLVILRFKVQVLKL